MIDIRDGYVWAIYKFRVVGMDDTAIALSQIHNGLIGYWMIKIRSGYVIAMHRFGLADGHPLKLIVGFGDWVDE